MRLHELAEALDLCEITPAADGDEEITRGYTSDLLSDILAHAPAGGVLVTILVNPDVVAVAGLAGLRAVIFSCGRTPDEHLVGRAAAERLSLFGSQSDSFEVVGRLHEWGLRGGQRPQQMGVPNPHGHRRTHHVEEDRRDAPPLPLGTGG
jgi:hypothetical protein